MIWFLRWFAAFRQLEAEVVLLSNRGIAQDDHIRRLTADLERAVERADEAQREVISTLKEFSRQLQPPSASDLQSAAMGRALGRQGRVVVNEGWQRFRDAAQQQVRDEIERQFRGEE
jgi:hypothetical protein